MRDYLLTTKSHIYTIQAVRADNATDVTAYNATLNGYLLDPVPVGNNVSYNYVYGICGTDPLLWPRTPSEVLVEVNGSQLLEPATVGELLPATTYCFTACVSDVTAGTPETCGNVLNFTTPAKPAVETYPPYYIGQ